MYWTAVLIALYATGVVGALWREGWRVRLVLAAIVAGAVTLRVVYPHQYPWGYHEDEITIVSRAVRLFCAGELVRGTVFGSAAMQMFLFTNTMGPLYAYTDLGLWWTARSLSLCVTSLAPVLAFGVGRGLRLSVVASLVVGVAMAVLPSMLVLGRTGIGGEVPFHGLLLLQALVWTATHPLAMVLVFTSSVLCCVGYHAGRVFLLCAAAFACLFPLSHVQRVAIVLTLVSAALVYHLEIATGEFAWYTPIHLQSILTGSVNDLLAKTWLTLSTFWQAPIAATTAAESITTANVLAQPWLTLVATGMIAALLDRRILVVWAVLGFLPCVITMGPISSRRLVATATMLPFFFGCTVDLVKSARRTLVAVVLALALSVWSIATFFSDAFWTQANRRSFCAFGCTLTLSGASGALPSDVPPANLRCGH